MRASSSASRSSLPGRSKIPPQFGEPFGGVLQRARPFVIQHVVIVSRGLKMERGAALTGAPRPAATPRGVA